jgi:hypothetical protein
MSEWNTGLQRAAQTERELWAAKVKSDRLKTAAVAGGAGLVVGVIVTALIVSIK